VVSKLPSTVSVEIEAGQVYDFVVATENLRYFDKATGQRIPAELNR